MLPNSSNILKVEMMIHKFLQIRKNQIENNNSKDEIRKNIENEEEKEKEEVIMRNLAMMK